MMGEQTLKKVILIFDSIKSQPHRVEPSPKMQEEDITRAQGIMSLCYSYRREWLERFVCDPIMRRLFEISYPYLKVQGSKTYGANKNNRKSASSKKPSKPSFRVKHRTFDDELYAIFEIVNSVNRLKNKNAV
jgi:hypothetical protein